MKKAYLSALALLGSVSPLLAQESTQFRVVSPVKEDVHAITHRACGAMEVLQAQLAADPAQAQRMAAIEAHTQRYIANMASSALSGQKGGPNQGGGGTTGVITVPVVVHVLWNTVDQDISNAQIQSQIDVLNEDYQKMNSDYGQTPPIYAGLVANVGVRFVLATRDPNGNATTGIVHKQTKVTSWSTNDAVKSSKRGGDDAWPAGSYLNLWACNLGQGLLGYAQFPGGQASTDGVVILYSAFGSRAKFPTGTYISKYDLGRTASHEVGHWMNLRHIWGDDNGACTGSDLVDDTPNQGAENYGCPTFPHVSCANSGDMSMNYMDYVDDQCMYMFSVGQSARMNAVFAAGGPRASIITSTGALRPGAGTATTAVSIFPNPGREAVSLTLPAGADASTYTVRVYDLRGYEMPQARYDGNGQLKVAALPKGLYYISIGNGTTTTRQRFEKE